MTLRKDALKGDPDHQLIDEEFGIMKSRHIRGAAMAVGAFAIGVAGSTAAANTYTYTFGTPSGDPYCDGITLTKTGTERYSGLHLNYDCAGDDQPAGGFKIKNTALGTVIEGVTLDPDNDPMVVSQMYYIDVENKTWYLYEIGGQFSEYTEVASGQMIKGAPPVGVKGGVPSAHPGKGTKVKPMPDF